MSSYITFSELRPKLQIHIDGESRHRASFEDDVPAVSYKLSLRTEKFWRYAYNRNIPKAEEYFVKVQETMLEILDEMMNADKPFRCTHDHIINGQTVSNNEGAVIEFGKGMTAFKPVGEAILHILKS